MSCKIFLDPGPYYSGAEIRGRLECQFRKSEKIRGIKIRTSGDEHTEWTRTETRYDENTKRHETVTYTCTGDNNLFNFEIMLYGGGGGEYHLGPGIFNYPFSFVLPANLPSTFMNHHGYVRYALLGIVDIPWGMDYEDKIFYEVKSLIDLNTFPMECFQPVSRSDNKTVCCWCCAQGDITLDININKTAFVPGEKVKLYLTLTNMSNSNVEGVSAKIMQYVKSKVDHPSYEHKEDEYEFSCNTWTGVGAHGENKYDMELLIPPENPYPNMNRSSLFEISYDVEICAAIDGCHSNMDLSFSIEIGHIQHQSQLDSTAIPPAEGNTQGYPSHQPGYPGSQPGYPGNQPGYPSNQPSYPYPTVAQPSAPLINFEQPNAGLVYPQGPQMSNPAGPPYPGGASSPPDYRSVYPGGPPAPSSSSMNSKEKESLGERNEAPSAPPSTDELPPSYEDASKNEGKK